MDRPARAVEKQWQSESLPLRLSDAKRHLAVSHDDRDSEIETLIRAAAEFLQFGSGRQWLTAGYILKLPCFPDEIDLPWVPLQEVELIRYVDADGAETNLAADQYQVMQSDEVRSVICVAPNCTWPTTQYGKLEAVKVHYVAGYGDTPEDMPAQFLVACKLLMRHWYDNPSAVVTGTISTEVQFSLKTLMQGFDTGYYAHV